MRFLRVLSSLVITLVVLLGAGCGGDDGGGGDTAATTTETTKQPSDSSIAMDEFSFDPEDATVAQGDTIDVTNEGAVAHNLTIEQGPDPTKKTKELAGTSTFQGGDSENLSVDVKPGKYAMVCTVSGHRDAGMVGTITVEAAGGG